MPTLVRLLSALAVIAALVVAAMAALIHFVEPRRSVITFEVPLERLQTERAPLRVDPGVPE
jgi:hypothetical protein